MSARTSLPAAITSAIFAAIENGETGGTFNRDGKALPTSGYYVGGAVKPLVNPTRAEVEAFVEIVGADYVGFWEDSETYALYIDAVDHVHTDRAALRLSELRGEIAYWDIRANDEIRVPVLV